MINILITSSTGFIGRNLLEEFAANSNFKLFSLNRSQLDIRNCDVFLDFIKSNKIDFIVNTAVSLHDLNNNILISYSLFKASAYCKSVLMLGSGIEYNPSRYIPKMRESYFDNNAFPTNDNIYHNSKFLSACLHESLNLKNVFNFRLFGVFGKYEDYKRRLISNNIFQYLTKKSLSYNKDISFDYLDVKDLARALSCFIDNYNDPNHITYNICTGRPLKFSQIMNQIVDFYHEQPSIIHKADPSLTDYEYSGSPARFEEEFNIQILNTPLQQSIQSIHNWLSCLPDVNQSIL